ncbi:hypothetical protein ACOMHN_007574 [Nucella lapillus]
MCDQVPQCRDESDENNCNQFKEVYINQTCVPSPVLINFNGVNKFVSSPMASNQTCPESHYRCPGEFNDCLPVYTWCNGMYDCIDHQDEEGCKDMICPGFFRCRASVICVHSDHLCDAWPHCPEHDDELLCDLTCPVHCLCQGHTFLCFQPFSAMLFPQLCYLDATGSDLLQSWTYRGFLWLITCFSVIGNIFCICARLFAKGIASSSGFSVFVLNLSMADFLMGVYIAVIGVADERFRGRYLHYDDSWKSSATCKLAGFLSLLSSEVSALIIWLITLDRFMVLHFPFSTFRFERSSAAVACLLTWLIDWCLALLPLLPFTSHWEFYSQTGICIPLPVTRKEFKGKVYSFGVLIIFNCVMFLFISVGQALIYWSIQSNTLKTNTTKMSRDVTIARRLITVAVTDFLYWFPIGICGMLAIAGTPISGEVNVGLAIFVLPLNSAVNPFMYTFNILVEKRRKSNEAKLLHWLESHADLIAA